MIKAIFKILISPLLLIFWLIKGIPKLITVILKGFADLFHNLNAVINDIFSLSVHAFIFGIVVFAILASAFLFILKF